MGEGWYKVEESEGSWEVVRRKGKEEEREWRLEEEREGTREGKKRRLE